MVFSERDCEFLPEDVRLSVAKPAESQMADARLAAYKLLSSASHALYLTYPVVDVTHQKCYPSAVLAQIQRTFPEAETLHQKCASLEPSYYSVTMHAAYYQYVQNYAAHNADTASIEQLLIFCRDTETSGETCRAAFRRCPAVFDFQSGTDAAVSGQYHAAFCIFAGTLSEMSVPVLLQ